jgi:hypothetical protein
MTITNSQLNGKILCNLLVNKIIEEFKILNKYHHTQIKVIDVGNFFIIKGVTDVDTPLNFSHIFSKYVLDFFGIEMSFNIVDLVKYGVNFNIERVSVELSLNKETYLNKINKKDFIDNKNELYESLTDVEYENSTKIYESDNFLGKSIMSSKIYEIYFRYIAHNIFERHLCSNLDILFVSISEFENINFDNVIFKISSNDLIVETEWLRSLILDIFNLSPTHIINHLGLEDYNFENEIINMNERVWIKKDKVGEMILF